MEFATAAGRRYNCAMERMRRLQWIFDRTPIFFVTACTQDRRAILANDSIHGRVEAFAKNGPSHGAWLGAYVWMPDHFHSFIALDDQLSLSNWIRLFKNALSKDLRQAGIAAPHWQKGFFDHLLRSEESYSEKWTYVRDDPVRAGLVRRWEDWVYRGEPFRLTM